jgi:hypothetical protein
MALRTLHVLGLVTLGAWVASSCAAFGDDTCGNGICEADETSLTCPADCGAGTCGNGICDIGENVANCEQDCSGGICGNAMCEASENTVTCPVDCFCGNNTCDTGESDVTCPADCGAGTCGNGICDATENATTCPQDCTTSPECGDGICNGTETAATCPADCSASCTDPICDLYPQCGCQTGEKCTLDSSSNNECVSAGSTQPGGICTADTDCAAGGICLGRTASEGQCLAYCDPTTQAGCTGTTSYCVELVDSSQIPIPGAGVCTFTCLPHNPTSGCPAGYGCEIYIHNISQVTFTDCHGDVGPGTYGSTCDPTNGPFCAAGYGCFNDGPPSHCYQWCTGTSSCAFGSCDPAAFTDPIVLGGTEYGICL